MQRIETDEVPGDTREFRRHLERLQWNCLAFARAANIKVRTAGEMYRGERPVPDGLMGWLRSMVETADQLPPPPPSEP
jgi:hypothetical protein